MSDAIPNGEDDVTLDPVSEENGSAARAACEEALRRFFAEGFQPGALISHLWLQNALGMPDQAAANSFEAYQRWQYTYMTRMVEFQKTLLLDHNIAMANVFGRGYRVILPSEQSAWALHESTRDMRKALSKGVARASHVNLDALTTEERKAQADDLNRIRALRTVLRKDEAAAKARARLAGMVGDTQ